MASRPDFRSLSPGEYYNKHDLREEELHSKPASITPASPYPFQLRTRQQSRLASTTELEPTREITMSFESIPLSSALVLVSLLTPFRFLPFSALVLIPFSAANSVNDAIRDVPASLRGVGESIASFRCFE